MSVENNGERPHLFWQTFRENLRNPVHELRKGRESINDLSTSQKVVAVAVGIIVGLATLPLLGLPGLLAFALTAAYFKHRNVVFISDPGSGSTWSTYWGVGSNDSRTVYRRRPVVGVPARQTVSPRRVGVEYEGGGSSHASAVVVEKHRGDRGSSVSRDRGGESRATSAGVGSRMGSTAGIGGRQPLGTRRDR